MPVTISSRPTIGVPQRPLRRATDRAILGGVCAGLAVRLGVSERTVRILFTIGAFAFGLGLVVYLATWLFATRSGEGQFIAQRLSRRRHDAVLVQFLLIVVVVALVTIPALDPAHTGFFAWAILLSLVALVAVWRGSSRDELAHLQVVLSATPLVGRASQRGWRGFVMRILPGVILVIVGINIMDQIGGVWRSAVPAVIGAMVLVGGLMILFAPWWLETVQDLSRERRERVRAEERSAMVTHIHDSVLQTLTLIERVAGNESDVRRLARAQERELRQWLFNPAASPDEGTQTFASLLGELERDVERDYGIQVELVIVGDHPADERTKALVAAGREAAINAAKWSGAATVSVFGESEPTQISLFVRDTGRGFDPDAVATDRQGIALSIRQRLVQVGGEATIRSAVGAGTEVRLVLPESPESP